MVFAQPRKALPKRGKMVAQRNLISLPRKRVEIIVQEVQPEKIILFGSQAREDYKGESDYDICVIKEGVKHRRKLAQQIYRLLYGIGVPVSEYRLMLLLKLPKVSMS